jgi:hypothetical protein
MVLMEGYCFMYWLYAVHFCFRYFTTHSTADCKSSCDFGKATPNGSTWYYRSIRAV